MGIKKFDSFISENLNEESPSNEGKNKFSKWLRGVNDRIKTETDSNKYYSRYSDPNTDKFVSANKAIALIPGAFRLIVGAGAAISDFFTKGDNKDTVSKYSKEDISNKKEENDGDPNERLSEFIKTFNDFRNSSLVSLSLFSPMIGSNSFVSLNNFVTGLSSTPLPSIPKTNLLNI